MSLPTFRLTMKGVITFVLVVGTGLVLLQLGRGEIPASNRDYFNITLGAWLSWAAMAVKRLVDGSESSDAKNATIAQQAQALAQGTANGPQVRS